MIKKIIIFAIFLLICWSLFIKNKSFSLSQHQWQDNIITAEKFIFDLDSIDNLVVGSSLANKIKMDSLPCFYNLSLQGQSIFDGLNILKNKKTLPKNVFIEMNFISRAEENSTFKEIVSSPILNVLKRHSLIFRTDKQPLAYVNNLAYVSLYNTVYRIKKKKDDEFETTKKSTTAPIDKTVLDTMLELQKNIYSAVIDTLKMDRKFNTLKNHVEFLESKGVNVIFFEMPVNPMLVELNEARYLRERLKKEYPNDFIKYPNNIDFYKTKDGIHLTEEESKIYTSYFKKKAIIAANRMEIP